MQVPLRFIGVDVSKAELFVATHGLEGCLSVPNECAAVAQWLRSLPAGSLVAMESTGRYHQLLASLAAGMAYSGLAPGPMILGAAGGVAACPSGAIRLCAIRCSWRPCRRPAPAPLRPLTRHCAPGV